jgi:hypothetical protein
MRGLEERARQWRKETDGPSSTREDRRASGPDKF